MKPSNLKPIARILLPLLPFVLAVVAAAQVMTPDKEEILRLIETHRASRLAALPPDFNSRFGATHVDGKYHLTDKPFLLEGAGKLLDMGTELGKFWFSNDAAGRSYSFNSNWPENEGLVALAETEYFQALWKMPFKTILLNTTAPSEKGWRTPGLPDGYYDAITRDYFELAAFFYQKYRDREVTVVFQNWEGDWMLRGIGESWDPPPPDWKERCGQMRRWIVARQAGVTRARERYGKHSRCIVAHAVEVNRVADGWKGIPTVTRDVLPGAEVDLVSYSAYDGINSGDPVKFWRCIDEIRAHVRTGPLFGPGAIMVGEYGIPENVAPERIRERCDEMLGVMLAQNVRFAAYWELYCNEFAGDGEKLKKDPPVTPVKDPGLMRGFWLIKPDGSLSESGTYFHELWQRATERNSAPQAPVNHPSGAR
jgi:hypothetical protein